MQPPVAHELLGQKASEEFAFNVLSLEGGYTVISPVIVPQVSSLGASPYDYDVFLIGLGVRYSY